MAKKKRKQTRSSRRTTVAADIQSIETQALKAPRRAINEAEFNPDYTPIVRDLKRIGTLAAIFFVVLVVLSFIF